VRHNDGFLPNGDPVRAEGLATTAALTGWKEAKSQLDKLELDVAMSLAKTAAAVSETASDFGHTDNGGRTEVSCEK